MSNRCVPGPINTCTVWWERVANKLLGHVRLSPTGGLKEDCDSDDPGLAICLVGNPPVEDPTDPLESGLRLSSDGCLWSTPSTRRKRKQFPSRSQNFIDGNTTVFEDVVTLDATNSLGDECWRVCMDICSAWIGYPQAEPDQVFIPRLDFNLGGGETFSIPAATHDVIPAPIVQVDGYHTIGEQRCWTHSANSGAAGPHSGVICTEITVPAGTSVDVPVRHEILINPGSAPLNTFSANSGDLTVTCERVACAEDC